jgi:hypothetical protein
LHVERRLTKGADALVALRDAAHLEERNQGVGASSGAAYLQGNAFARYCVVR